MERLLLVDDNPDILEANRSYFEDLGYDAVACESGRAAVSLLRGERFDCIVLDVMMPKLDGYAFTRALREAGSEIPVLMVSAKQLPADRRMGFIAGTDDYITKPIDEQEMLLRIKALLRRAKIASDRRIEIGSVVLDYDSLSVTGHGGTQVLPQQEFLLLYKLLSYPGKIFTRIQLMDEIWGMETDSGWETVTVHIGRLRKRFEGWEEFHIESVRGLGYRAVRDV